MANYKTTILGVLTILGIICKAALAILNSEPLDYSVLATGISAGVGLLLAKDAGVTGTAK